MSDRRKREKREQRLSDATPVRSPRVVTVDKRPRDPSPDRVAKHTRSALTDGVRRVANAHRAVEALPDAPVMRQQGYARLSAPLAEARDAPRVVGQLTARAVAPPPKAERRASVGDYAKPKPTCKARPTSSKGDGSGRPFVPWCKRR